MAFDHLADLDLFLGDMGETATITPAGGDPSTVTVIFSREFVAIEGVETQAPTVTAKTADLVGVKAGASVVLGAGTFTVFGIENGGTGFTTLVLTGD